MLHCVGTHRISFDGKNNGGILPFAPRLGDMIAPMRRALF